MERSAPGGSEPRPLGSRAVSAHGGSPIVELDGVDKYFGSVHVLKNISLKVYPSEVVAILGPSGSGKSTLCRCVNGLELAQSGQISVNGVPMPKEGKGLAAMRAQVGMVFQAFNLFAHKTIIENITLGPIKVRHISRGAAEKRALELLERVGIADQAKKHPAELSGGQQQRAAIARALAMDPSVILFDEPTSALDPEMIHEVLDVMEQLAHAGTTMIVITHEMSFARRVATRAIFMDAGEIIESAPPDILFTQPTAERTKQFLSNVTNL